MSNILQLRIFHEVQCPVRTSVSLGGLEPRVQAEDAQLSSEEKVKQLTMKWTILVFTLAVVMMLGACGKKVAPPPPPPPPAPTAPTASLTANPETVEKGGST